MTSPLERRSIPSFTPHPWLKGAHFQTVVGRYLSPPPDLPAVPREILLDDGDRLLVLDSIPPGWTAPDPAAIVVHGLAGCANAAYVARLGLRLVAAGVRVARVNLRGAGAGFGLAKGIYHAGRSDDVRAVARWLARDATASPIAVAGFSLGASLALKLAAEHPDDETPALDCVVAANPPIDLAACARRISEPMNRLYDWNFVRWLRATTFRLHERFPELGRPDLGGVRSVYQFDDRYTAPRNGFRSADHYYETCRVAPILHRIETPTLIVHAGDDPFIPIETFHQARLSPRIELEITSGGGHLGYLSRDPFQGDRRWLEARMAGWLLDRWRRPISAGPAWEPRRGETPPTPRDPRDSA